MNKQLLSLIGFVSIASANSIQAQLMSIATEEAQIANIGANKYMMLYGTENPIPVINRWNEIENHPTLTTEQIAQINALEITKQQFLKQGMIND